MQEEYIEVQGARVHNLKNIDVKIPREKLVVITGLSGSGKSSLAFDTIYAEGQRRYVETFSAYARQFLGGLERPDVDKIDGLSPVIAIEQKTTSKSPRSTVGTITEVYDFLRLLFARASDAYSYNTGEKMVSYSDEQIVDLILEEFNNKKINILAPVIKSRKGHYRELFEQISKQGFVKVRVDGELSDIEKGMRLDRYKTHDIEIVIDRIQIDTAQQKRVLESVKTAMYHGDDTLLVLDNDNGKVRYFSRSLMCPSSGISYPKPEPNSFSFNSPKGACEHCNGLGSLNEVNLDKIVPNKNLSIFNGGIAPLKEQKSGWITKQIELIAERYGFKLNTPVKDIPKEALEIILHGGNEKFDVVSKQAGITRTYEINFEGIANFIRYQFNESNSISIKRWASNYMDEIVCDTCGGSRLKQESLYFKIADRNIFDLSRMDLIQLAEWFASLRGELSEKQQIIASEIIKEIETRVQFLLDVGLDYLTLDRSAPTLSGGENQRIRLARQLGSGLTGVLYTLDEPSIGLHPFDSQLLNHALRQLIDLGNTLLVVEHDPLTIAHADYILDFGPQSGDHGGHITAKGTLKQIQKSPHSLTGAYLSGRKEIPIPKKRRKGNTPIRIQEASLHNLHNLSLSIPTECI
ncbi:MAG: excinuclease ABC subunit UvrA, partial [Flavobacteriaceae bacterium]|nr:excinuclease ABC subunit UvrA [Flavobacteriaceae bacterium]